MQHVAKLTRTWLVILGIPLLPLTLCTVVSLLVKGGKATARTASSAVRSLQKPKSAHGGSTFAGEMTQEIVAELVSDVIWSLLKRRKD